MAPHMMPLHLVNLIGLTAATLTTIALIPQALRIWRTRSTHDISLSMFAVYTLGIFLWLVYGLAIGDVPLIGSNAVSFALSGLIVYFKLRYG